MSDNSELLTQLQQDLLRYDASAAAKTAEAIVESGGDLMQAIDTASAAIHQVGDRFQCGDIYLPELMLAGNAMKQCMNVLAPHLAAQRQAKRRAKVVIAAVSGDIHDIGKNLVATMLSVNGFDVIDLGVNVAPLKIVDAAEREQAQVIALSSLMTTSMPYQRDVLSLLTEIGTRGKFYVIVGGGPVTPDFAREIHADGWGASAVSAVRVCERLLDSQHEPSVGEPVLEN